MPLLLKHSRATGVGSLLDHTFIGMQKAFPEWKGWGGCGQGKYNTSDMYVEVCVACKGLCRQIAGIDRYQSIVANLTLFIIPVSLVQCVSF